MSESLPCIGCAGKFVINVKDINTAIQVWNVRNNTDDPYIYLDTPYEPKSQTK